MTDDTAPSAALRQEPIPRKKLSHGVLDRLTAQMGRGDFPPGSLLPSERQLMESFQVGRPAVREALQELQRMGLIVITHGERARVVAPTARSVLDQIAGTAQHLLTTSPQSLDYLKEARQFFEVGIVRLAAARATPEDVERLLHLIAQQEAAGDDFAAFMKADLSFHRAIAGILDNPIFAAVSEAMLEWLSAYHTGLVRQDGRERLTLLEHRQITECIAAHDVDGAAAAMLTHLTRARDLYDTLNRKGQ